MFRQSTHFAQGGYEPVAEVLFNECKCLHLTVIRPSS
jgi:hypothetical protein